jgi:translation initiation factor IF-1
MVKNTQGGSKAKGFARKNFVKGNAALRLSEDESEVYVQVTKMLGGALCHVINTTGENLLCHIRGKFRGRGKRDNFISLGTWLLVGMREWEKEASKGKLLNCDLIEVYTDTDKTRLKDMVTTVNWSAFITNDTKVIGNPSSSEDIGFDFDNKTYEFQEIIEKQLAEATETGKKITIVMNEADEEINIDDI